MPGYSDNREQNIEVKQLRKVLLQIDKRICVPESIEGDRLRALIDNIEHISPNMAGSRGKRMTPRSLVALAAAFVLIVALFYSMEMYKPEMITGGMRIEETSQDALSAEAPKPQILPDIDAGETAPSALMEPEAAAGIHDEAESAASESAEISGAPDSELGVGGLESTLLLEQGGFAYYWTKSDPNDPDSLGYPVTVEVVDQKTNALQRQLYIAYMTSVDRLFAENGGISLIGHNDAGGCIASFFDEAGSEIGALNDLGALVDANLYKDFLYIAVDGGEVDGGPSVTLPNSADESSVVTIFAVNTKSLDLASISLKGANGSVQLQNANAYIHYQGIGETDEIKDFIAQINFDGPEIALGPVS